MNAVSSAELIGTFEDQLASARLVSTNLAFEFQHQASIVAADIEHEKTRPMTYAEIAGQSFGAAFVAHGIKVAYMSWKKSHLERKARAYMPDGE